MLTFVPQAKPFVAEVRDIDLSRPLPDTLLRDIRTAWTRHPVLLFRDQNLDEAAHQAFAERLGPLQTRARPAAARGNKVGGNPYLMLVTNIRDADGQPIGSGADGGPLEFHSDGCFKDRPSMATTLYGIEVPSQGGETLFVDMNQVYESLPAKTRRRLLGRMGVNFHFYGYSTFNKANGTARPDPAQVTHAIHPLVIAHPETGRPSVFANRHNTLEIVGMDQAEADDLLQEIFLAVERPEFIHTHAWRTGDLVVWDNRAVQHARSDFAPTERRLLRRFAVMATERPPMYEAAAESVAS